MLFGRKKKKNETILRGDVNRPRHIAIIMDGNGRWAKKRGLPRTAGHAVGAETFRTIATHCKNIGIEYLTVFAFSTENWKRSDEEVATIMTLLEKYLLEAIDSMAENKIQLRFFGDLTPLSAKLRTLCQETQGISETYESELQVNICLNYGGRDEILNAVRACASDCLEGKIKPEEIDHECFTKHLYSADIPDPDLVIRPSGEVRVSNFLLWQSAYAEYFYTDTLWPDFTASELNHIINEFSKRQRRFGGI